MQFTSDNLSHFVKMRPTIEKIKSASTFTTSKSECCFGTEDGELQLQWSCCLICGKYNDRSSKIPIKEVCYNKEHINFCRNEDLKSEITFLIKAIDNCDKYGCENGEYFKKKLLSYSMELAGMI